MGWRRARNLHRLGGLVPLRWSPPEELKKLWEVKGWHLSKFQLLHVRSSHLQEGRYLRTVENGVVGLGE